MHIQLCILQSVNADHRLRQGMSIVESSECRATWEQKMQLMMCCDELSNIAGSPGRPPRRCITGWMGRRGSVGRCPSTGRPTACMRLPCAQLALLA
jgi:hypothetical protein